MTQRVIEAFDGTSIWFTDTEVDGPTVVLLHGLSMTSITNFDTNYGPDEAGRIGLRLDDHNPLEDQTLEQLFEESLTWFATLST